MRIKDHPILNVPTEKNYVTFYFEDQPVCGTADDTIASALIANGFDVFGFTEHNHPRGFFCAIGKCSACLVEVDGVPNVRACITPIREGMRVKMQRGRGKPKW
ncbi:2Fe-2S iron-sulfur cluster binding domain-containing protein [Fervidobacterium changbaicum]|uniref:(2Fe-2S)-binding protein n=2 Tax=Fervidobacterium TaxID=2422 RepID=A0AAI8CLJ6_FERIS|nr:MULTISPECIES: (2Fe-2S)-binding protein [Fervidobacterium]AMW32567.1 (2Fe-2S)-binding protein [Fervidobacterium islandicum]QAV32582.1 pyridine nucleotide-disulfide oxidoreductase [Fervidobacterium changbaicum]SDH66256.1 2Fe-2S iron-sulfur cluster binding domain-containing protein [Fervidobacterium changbaicum]